MTKFNIYAFLYCVPMVKVDAGALKLSHFIMTKLEIYKFSFSFPLLNELIKIMILMFLSFFLFLKSCSTNGQQQRIGETTSARRSKCRTRWLLWSITTNITADASRSSQTIGKQGKLWTGKGEIFIFNNILLLLNFMHVKCINWLDW